MAGEGAVLRKAREEQSLSYKNIEGSIKIRVSYLEALENENYDVLPGVTYTRGFLRTYAKYLGINPQEIVDSYNASLVKETEPEIQSPIRSKRRWFRPLVLAVMAILALIIVIVIILESNFLSIGNASGLSFIEN